MNLRAACRIDLWKQPSTLPPRPSLTEGYSLWSYVRILLFNRTVIVIGSFEFARNSNSWYGQKAVWRSAASHLNLQKTFRRFFLSLSSRKIWHQAWSWRQRWLPTKLRHSSPPKKIFIDSIPVKVSNVTE